MSLLVFHSDVCDEFLTADSRPCTERPGKVEGLSEVAVIGELCQARL